MNTKQSKNKLNYIFAGAQTIDGSLVNTFETSNKKRAEKMLEDRPGGFYRELKNHNRANENTKVFVWKADDL